MALGQDGLCQKRSVPVFGQEGRGEGQSRQEEKHGRVAPHGVPSRMQATDGVQG